MLRALNHFVIDGKLDLPLLFINGSVVDHSKLEKEFAEEAGEPHPNASRTLSWLTDMFAQSGAYMHVDDCAPKQKAKQLSDGQGISPSTVSWGQVIYEALIVVVMLGAVIALYSQLYRRIRQHKMGTDKKEAEYSQVGVRC